MAAPSAAERGLDHPDFHVWYQPETEPDYVQKLLRYTLSLGGSAKTPKLSRKKSSFRSMFGLFCVKTTSLSGHHSRFGTN